MKNTLFILQQTYFFQLKIGLRILKSYVNVNITRYSRSSGKRSINARVQTFRWIRTDYLRYATRNFLKHNRSQLEHCCTVAAQSRYISYAAHLSSTTLTISISFQVFGFLHLFSAYTSSGKIRMSSTWLFSLAEDRCLEVSLKVKDDCSTERCSVKALPLPRSQSDDMEENGVHLQMEISSNKVETTRL